MNLSIIGDPPGILEILINLFFLYIFPGFLIFQSGRPEAEHPGMAKTTCFYPYPLFLWFAIHSKI
jgi:hypothetical protein